MSSWKWKAPRSAFFVLDGRILVGLIGLFLSVALHELFHAWMHWGHIASIGFFTDPFTIVAIAVYVPAGYDVELEETLAYAISLVVLVLTAAVIGKMYDAKDSRSIQDILGLKPDIEWLRSHSNPKGIY